MTSFRLGFLVAALLALVTWMLSPRADGPASPEAPDSTQTHKESRRTQVSAIKDALRQSGEFLLRPVRQRITQTPKESRRTQVSAIKDALSQSREFFFKPVRQRVGAWEASTSATVDADVAEDPIASPRLPAMTPVAAMDLELEDVASNPLFSPEFRV